MAVELFGNGGTTSLAAAVDNLATTLGVASASGFPTGTGQYRIRVDDELMVVTGGAGTTTWTVTRGAEGTAAVAHASGATVRHVLTAGALTPGLIRSGGAAGQVLIKATAADYDVAWGAGVPSGTEDQALRYNAAGAAVAVTPPWGGGAWFRRGFFHHGLWGIASYANTALSLDQLATHPFVVPARTAFDRIGISVGTAAAAGGTLRFGIYATGAAGVPGALVHETTTIDSTTTGAKELALPAGFALNAGLYWLAVVAQGAACSVSTHNTILPFYGNNSTAQASVTNDRSYPADNGVTGALPATFTVDGSTIVMPAVMLRATA